MSGRREDERLGRRSAAGDPVAARRLARRKFSEGRWRDVTLGELEALVADRERKIMGPGGPPWIEASRDDFGMPEEAKGVCLRAGSGAPPLPGYVPLPGAWILDGHVRGDPHVRSSGPRPTHGERWFPLADPDGDEGDETRWGQVHLFGAPHHAQLIRVEDDDDGHQQPVGDPHGRYGDVQHVYHARAYVPVRIPGLPGEWVLEIHPHED